MDSQQAQAACLDTLEASVNSILLNIGSVFNEQVEGDSARAASCKSRLDSAIPSALNDYHEALDVLESDLIRAKAVLSRDLVQLQAAAKASATPPKTTIDTTTQEQSESAKRVNSHPSDSDGFELINDVDIVMTDAADESKPPGPATATAPMATNQQAQAVPMTKVESKTGNSDLQSTSEAKPIVLEDDAKKPLQPAPDAEGNNALGIHVIADTKSESQIQSQSDNKTSPKDQNDQVSDNGFNDLLPGLSMYANDPNNDHPPMMDMDNVNDQSLSNAFGDGGDTGMQEFEADLFGDGDLNAGLGGNGNSFADMFDSSAGQDGDGQGGLDVFDDDFFNLNGE